MISTSFIPALLLEYLLGGTLLEFHALLFHRNEFGSNTVKKGWFNEKKNQDYRKEITIYNIILIKTGPKVKFRDKYNIAFEKDLAKTFLTFLESRFME